MLMLILVSSPVLVLVPINTTITRARTEVVMSVSEERRVRAIYVRVGWAIAVVVVGRVVMGRGVGVGLLDPRQPERHFARNGQRDEMAGLKPTRPNSLMA